MIQENLYIRGLQKERESGAAARGRSAGALGGAVVLITAGALVFWPLALAGVLFMGASAGLDEESHSRNRKSEYLEAASLSTKAVLDSLEGFTMLVEVGETFVA